MTSHSDQDAFRKQTLTEVKAHIRVILKQSEGKEVADNLLWFGLYLVEVSRVFALPSVFAAFDKLRKFALVTPVDEGRYLMLTGLFDFHQGRLDKARSKFEIALAAGLELQDRDLAANSAQNLGIVEWTTGNLDGAEKNLIRSNEIRPSEDQQGFDKVLVTLASLYLDGGETDKSTLILDRLSASPAMSRRGADRSALLGLRGLQAVREGRLEVAERLLREGCREARRRSAISHEIVNLQNLGSVRVDLGKPGQALRPLRRAIALAQLVEDHRTAESAQRTLATAFVHAGRHREAIDVLAEADRFAGQRNDGSSHARIAADLGALYMVWSKPAMAIGPLRQALDLFVQERDQSWGPKTALNLGLALARTGPFVEALELVRQAGSQVLEDPGEVGDLLETFGDAVLWEASPSDCASAYRAAVREYSKRVGSVADRLAEMASKLYDARMPGESVSFYDEALTQHDPQTCHIARYQILNDRGLAKTAIGEPEAGLVDIRDALELAQDEEDRAMQVRCLGNLSEMIRRNGDFEMALGPAQAGLAIARQLQNPVQIGDALATLGLAQFALSDVGGATDSFSEALHLARKVPNSSTEAVALGGLAQVAFSKRRYRRALSYYLRAVDLEAGESDPTHETETWAALAETAAKLKDPERFGLYLQHLIDVVQAKKGPLTTALDGIQRAGSIWLEEDRVELAGETFVTGIVLGAAESVKAGEEEMLSVVARTVVAPYFAASRLGKDAGDLERAMRQSLRKQIGKSSRMIEHMFPIAMDAVRERR